MDIKKLTEKDLILIKNKIKDNIDLREIYKSYKDYFNKPISYKKFCNIFIDYILNGFENESLFIFDDYYFNLNEQHFRLTEFKYNLKQENTDDLIKYNLENERFNNFEYLEYDYIIDDLKEMLQQKDFNYIENSRSNDIYIKIEGIEGILDLIKDYTLKEFLKDLDNLVYDYDLKNIFLMFIKDYHKNSLGYTIKPNLDFNKLDNEIKRDNKQELKLREKNLNKDNKKINTILIKLKSIKDKKPLINQAIKVYDNDLNKQLDNNKNELLEIIKHLYPKRILI